MENVSFVDSYLPLNGKKNCEKNREKNRIVS